MKIKGLVLFLVILLVSCKKDKPPVKEKNDLFFGNKRIFITNEGNYGFSNSALSLYDPQNSNVSEDVYSDANSGINAGDVMQSIAENSQYFFLVLNNSSKVIAIDKNNFQKKFEITGFSSPRYFIPINNSKAYVSNYYSNSINVVDLNTQSIVKSINVNGWTEEMAMLYGKVFVCNRKSDYMHIIQTSNDSVCDSVMVGYGSNSVVLDKNDKLWVCCEGNSSQGIYPRIVRLNPVTHQVEAVLQFSNLNDSPWRLKVSGNGENLYYLNNGVYTLSINGGNLSSVPLISQGSKIFYGLGIDPENENIYVADAIDYIQKGSVLIYSKSGSLQSSFKASIIPGEFYFDYP